MSGTKYSPAVPGTRFHRSASAHNLFLNTAQAVSKVLGPQALGKDVKGGFPSLGSVIVKNSSGSDVDRFGVLAAGGVFIEPDDGLEEFQSARIFDGVVPTTDYLGRILIALEPIASGAYGRCAISGLVPVQVYIEDEDHWAADVIGSLTQLQSGASGSARIMYKGTGTTTMWCLVLLGSTVTAPAALEVVKIADEGPPLLGDLLAGFVDDAPVWDSAPVDETPANDAHYAVQDIGTGCAKVGEVFPIVALNGTTRIIATTIAYYVDAE